jgi:aminoglycoside/choline kinase family phosphotransferase
VTAGRNRQIEEFLYAAGWAGAKRVDLAQDASFRRYERILLGGKSVVLMDAPPDKEDVTPFLRIARALSEMGLSAPRIIGEDAAKGLLLLEDLGDETFTRLLDGGAPPMELYSLAADALVALHSKADVKNLGNSVPLYEDPLFVKEALLLTEWYLPAVTGSPTDREISHGYQKIWEDLLPKARGVPNTLVLRDYHVDNLVRIAGRSGVGACGLLDFQDAVLGPLSYDFISLVEDARRDVAATLAADIRKRYLNANPAIDPEAFDRSCAILGAQRHCKVLGIFTRLRDRDGKDRYLHHVPRLWRLLERSVEHPALESLKDWLEEYLPLDLRIVPPGRLGL